MEKKENIKKGSTTHIWKYPKSEVDKILSLIKEGKTLNEILKVVEPKKSAVRRYARKAGLTLKK